MISPHIVAFLSLLLVLIVLVRQLCRCLASEDGLAWLEALNLCRREWGAVSFMFVLQPGGVNTMTGQHEIVDFKKMWAWLMGYPAHDQKYYMKHVARLDKDWDNDCPLSNRSEVSSCDGCKMLWQSQKGTLCSDSNSPLYKWKNTDIELPDDRSYFASQTAVLAMKFLRSHADQTEC